MKMKAMLTLMLFLVSPMLLAGTSCENRLVKPDLYVQASRRAIDLETRLNRLNPSVALVARVGTNLDKYRIHFSHVAFAVRDYPGRKGKWTVLHLLNECGTRHSSIYAQGLLNFFMDNLYRYDYQITVPDSETQARLYQALMPGRIENLHGARYSMIAWPFSARYQNSNQWVLEVIASSLAHGSSPSRRSAQAWLQKTGYQPSVIKLDPLSKLGASMTGTPVAFDDHPIQENRTNHFSTVTVDSIVRYLKRQAHARVYESRC